MVDRNKEYDVDNIAASSRKILASLTESREM
jgi:hypothetical protein